MESIRGVIREHGAATAFPMSHQDSDAGRTKQSRWHKRQHFCPNPYGSVEGLKKCGGRGLNKNNFWKVTVSLRKLFSRYFCLVRNEAASLSLMGFIIHRFPTEI